MDTLQGNRTRTDGQDAADALNFFRGDLSRPEAHGYFLYKKKGQVHVCNKPATVAMKWRQLLAKYPAIAREWERVRADRASQSTASISHWQ